MSKFKDITLKKLLYNKRFSVIVSIIIAFAFWMVIVIEQNPEREQTFNNLPIEISTEGTILGEQGLEVAEKITQTASVTVFGPNYIVSSLKSSDIKVSADLSVVNGAGTYTINLSAVRSSNESGYSFVNISPSSVTVEFDYFDEKSFAVMPKIEGYGMVDGLTYDNAVVANAEQSQITVRGPRAEVNKIASVVAFASTDKVLKTTTTFEGKIQLLDSDGNELDTSKYDLSEDSINISVPVSKTKILKFSPSYTNMWDNSVAKALNKYWTADIDKFTVAGPPEVIDALDFIEFTPIDVIGLSSRKSKNVFEVSPVLPNGVRIIDGIETITITYNLSDFAVKRIKITNFDDENTLSGGKTASYTKDIYVEVCGKKSEINSLSSSDCYLAVDLSDLSTGEHLIAATLKTYNGSAVWQVTSCEITVRIK